MKQKTKRGPRGPYKKRGTAKAKTKSGSKLRKVKLTFLNLGLGNRARTTGVRVGQTIISMDGETASRMGAKKGTYIVVGEENKIPHLVIKPKGVVAGNIASQAPSGRVTIAFNNKKAKLSTGVYSLGEMVESTIPGVNGEPVPIFAYPLVSE